MSTHMLSNTCVYMCVHVSAMWKHFNAAVETNNNYSYSDNWEKLLTYVQFCLHRRGSRILQGRVSKSNLSERGTGGRAPKGGREESLVWRGAVTRLQKIFVFLISKW